MEEKKKILIIDNDKLVLLALRMILEQDYEVVEATSVPLALNALETFTFHIIITDMHMDIRTDGLAIIDIVRNYLRLSTPIIVISAYPHQPELFKLINGTSALIFMNKNEPNFSKKLSDNIKKLLIHNQLDIKKQQEEFKKNLENHINEAKFYDFFLCINNNLTLIATKHYTGIRILEQKFIFEGSTYDVVDRIKVLFGSIFSDKSFLHEY